MSTLSIVRERVLTEFNRHGLMEFRQPGTGVLYSTEEILRSIGFRLGGADYAYLRGANRLSVASLVASLDDAIGQREHANRAPLKRKTRSSSQRDPHWYRWSVHYRDRYGRVHEEIVEATTHREALVAGKRVHPTGSDFTAIKSSTKPLR